jgi:hypothetical protein
MFTRIFPLVFFLATALPLSQARIPEDYVDDHSNRTPASEQVSERKVIPLTVDQVSVEQRKASKAEKTAARKAREHECLSAKVSGNYHDCPVPRK